MDRTELYPYQRITSKKKLDTGRGDIRMLLRSVNVRDVMINGMAFLIGRAFMLPGLTPFGVAFYAAGFKGDLSSVILGVFVMAGLLTAGLGISVLKYFFAMVLISIYQYLFRKSQFHQHTLAVAITAFAGLFLAGLGMVAVQGFLLYDVLMLLFESFICFIMVFVFRKGLPAVRQKAERNVLSNEEIISLAITIGLLILGIGEISLWGGISVRNTLCISVLLLFSLRYGVGVAASAGVTMGLMNSMASPGMPYAIGSYAFCGLIAAIFRSFGKVGVCLGFVLANAILTVYINGSTEVIINIYEIFAAIVLLAVTPQKFTDFFEKLIGSTSDKVTDKRNYVQRFKEITVGKLNGVSKSFEELAATFNSIAEKKTAVNTHDVAIIFDQVAEKVCKNCGLCFCCWEKEFHSTYQVMFKILERLDEKGEITVADVPQYFASRCIHPEKFVNAINSVYEIHKVNLMWHNKVDESRGLVSQQFQGVSKIISNLANEIIIDLKFNEELENQLMIGLDREGIGVKDVTVLENGAKKYEVEVTFKPCGGRRQCLKEAVPVISNILGRKMTKADAACRQNDKSAACAVKFIEEEAYRVSMGVACMKKDGQAQCGDHYTFMQLPDGKHLMALSDGMGSGKRASRESSATIALLEQFLESGFDKDTAVKLINSVLVLKSSIESFATIDLCVIDLFKGSVEFIKIGAATTFIKRGERVETVKSTSLPAGILNHIDMELSNKVVTDGDFVVMMSDGVLESKDDAVKQEDWVKAALAGMDTTNAQEIADTLMEMAAENYGNRAYDDMSILVAKIWSKI